ncbi:class I SAM-dependent methyltransferase [Mycobacterium sp. 852002-51961_SCH5331710]|uniref:class I SAM-dependent methyltransferase n=1 Tax=Mycobacterium sp. 852002-51961_SCH5331710 TaxID=1834105 RepID=UPI0007FE3149|nr:class I SAM-dependent methyltransferase [Mycobacterium sp. 852002-51961_SCH5331710]OBB48182.1 SAM-dependent methyltransferase [Mycobacterium sp. 852002-51961_SCH5331710]
MTENTPTTEATGHHDYLPAAGHDMFLPAYDLLTRALGFRRAYRTLIAQADLRDGMTVLEVGCGTGNLIVAAHQAHPGIAATGCDPDPLALRRAERKARGLTGVTFDRGYAQRLPHADGVFDRVLSSMMWHHLDDDTKDAAAEQIFRVLRPGGELHLVDIGGEVSAEDGVLARRLMRSAHAAGNRGDAIPRQLRGAGFECTQVGHQRVRVFGHVAFFRAVRPA